MNLLDDQQRGSIAGEGATFLFLENCKNEHTYARLDGLTTFLKPSSGANVSQRLHEFLAAHGLSAGDISLLILGLNGDPRTDLIYHTLAETDFSGTPLAYFKHLCGEYHTASAFATWMAAMALKTQSVPEVVRVNSASYPKTIPFRNIQESTPAITSHQSILEHVLIYNHFQENNHSFILLSSI